MAGCAMHADLAPESAGSAMFGWALAMLGQQFGFPAAEGGAGNLTAALVRRLESRGGVLRCGAEVRDVLVRGGRATGVRTAEGELVMARRAVLADVAAPALYGQLVPWDELPPPLRDDMRHFQWDYSTVKVDWALSGEVPWRAAGVSQAGVVHVGGDMDAMTRYCAQLAMGQLPDEPFVIMGQMTTADPTRSPPGTQSLWGYTHVPRGLRWDAGEPEVMADRVEQQIERFAPGFSGMVRARHVLGPHELEVHNANAVGGAVNGGTAALHQQLFFRPTPGLGRPETPVRGLYLASASAHPGGGVHGACGANAARAALRQRSPARQWLVSKGISAARRLLGEG